MVGVGQEAERLDHVRDLTPRCLDCLLEVIERQRDLAPGIAGLERPVHLEGHGRRAQMAVRHHGMLGGAAELREPCMHHALHRLVSR